MNETIAQNLKLSDKLEEMSDVAKKASEATKDIKATKGRASYLGERSIGHIDPGFSMKTSFNKSYL